MKIQENQDSDCEELFDELNPEEQELLIQFVKLQY